MHHNDLYDSVKTACCEKNFFFQQSCRKWDRKTSCKPLVYKKHTYTDSDWYSGLFNFHFLEKGLGLAFLPHFVCDFQSISCYSINWPNFIVWLYLVVEILNSKCILIICFAVYDVIKFEINLRFFIQVVFQHDQKSQYKNLYKYLKHEITFQVKWKTFFINFKGLSVARSGLRPESVLLKNSFPAE